MPPKPQLLVDVPDHLLTSAQLQAKRQQLSNPVQAVQAVIPTFQSQPAQAWHVGFTASTGGLCQAHVVQNFVVYIARE